MKHLPAVLFFACALAAPAAAQPVTAAQAAANLERALATLRTLEARFEQLYYSASVSLPLDERGEVYFRKPDEMRWEYRDPQKKVFLYKAGLCQMYLAEDNQLTRSRVSPEAYDADILGIFLGTRSFAETYRIEDAQFPTGTGGAKQVKLTPLEEGDYSHILIEIDLKTWLLRRAVFFEWTGNKREYLFSRIRVDASLPARVFELDVPADCEIIDEDGTIRR